MSIGQIIEGSINNLAKRQQELFEKRIKICRECKLLRKDVTFGEVCNSRLYLNPKTDEVVRKPQPGFFRGCGCVLGSKTRAKSAKCPAKKW